MKCCAPVEARPLTWRADRSTDRSCHRPGSFHFCGKWFCYQHAGTWGTHYRIVEQIRAIPNRDILGLDGA
jgi:hypothetical protein